MRHTDFWAGLLLALLALAGLLWLVPAQVAPAPGASMSPAMLPNLALGGILLLALALMMQALWRGAPAAADAAPLPSLGLAEARHLLLLALVMAAGAAAIGFGSFLAASCIILWGLMVPVCRRPPLRSLLWTVGIAGALQLPLSFLSDTALR